MSLSVRRGFTQQADVTAAAKELGSQISQPGMKVVLVFASSTYDGQALVPALRKTFPNAPVMACSTAGEITPEGFKTKSIAAVSLASPKLAAGIALVDDLSGDLEGTTAKALKAVFDQVGSDLQSFDATQHVLMVFPDGLAGKEEALLLTIRDLAPELAIVGGSTGDDFAFKQTWVSDGQRIGPNLAGLVLIKTSHAWTIERISSYQPTGKTLKITKANPDKRLIFELDHQPVVAAYAKALGISADQVPGAFFEHPLGVQFPDGYYNRSPMKILDDGSVLFCCNIGEGSTVHLMQAGDVLANLQESMTGLSRRMNNRIAAILSFNCGWRFMESEQKKITSQVFDLLKKTGPVIGYISYGEQFNSLHMNQTLTMLVFGSE